MIESSLWAAAVLMIRWWDVYPFHIELCSKSSCFLVEEERELPVDEEVVIDGGEACAQLHLRPLVAQIHGCSQGQVVVTCSIKWVLRRQQNVQSYVSLTLYITFTVTSIWKKREDDGFSATMEDTVWLLNKKKVSKINMNYRHKQKRCEWKVCFWLLWFCGGSWLVGAVA